MATNRYPPQLIQTGSSVSATPGGSSGSGSVGSGFGAGTGVEPYSPLGTPDQLVDPETIYTKQNIIGTKFSRSNAAGGLYGCWGLTVVSVL